MNPVDPNLDSSSNNNEVGGMFSNSGDASRPDRSTEGRVGGTFSNTDDAPSRSDYSGGSSQVGGMFSNSGDAPPKAPVNPNRQNAEAGMFSNSSDSAQPDAYGGAQREQGMGPQDPNLGDGEGGDYDDEGGNSEGKKKHGILGKIKEAFVPKPGGIGRAGNEDLNIGDAAGFQPGRDTGRHEQANRDLNRE
ncbi:hypothetical protein N431DRAFT_478407 [Stipitochalara longipes BDJ]|nr:hypothetical protein N431DRAFT_478407 [Stipitochalara longipes BDJ]